ncbi:endonuclease/exonuclease/phosphatase family protein [Humitalea sp. 24SJ18S-53]|uniref:endonuclease/exonuclease/phosphatase family protein n=1 Tax=Humitalea sp. 24SJ18S-53 TaxID=3422307 RepID=UPI003D664A0C
MPPFDTTTPAEATPRPHRLPDQVRGALRMLEGALARRALNAAHRPAAPREGLIAASYNIHKCVGMDKRFDPRRVADVIAELGADVVALQEADRRFGHRAGLLDLAHLERHAGLTLIPASPVDGGHGWHGNALLVRGGRATRVRRLALPGAEPRGALIVDLALDGGPLRVVAAHLGLLRRHRLRQAEAILTAVRDAPAMPTLLLGDMNEWRPGIASSLAVLEPMFGPFGHPVPSFPSRLPFLALDQVLGHPRGLVAATHVHDSPLARLASDHLPIWARIDVAAAAETGSAAA